MLSSILQVDLLNEPTVDETSMVIISLNPSLSDDKLTSTYQDNSLELRRKTKLVNDFSARSKDIITLKTKPYIYICGDFWILTPFCPNMTDS